MKTLPRLKKAFSYLSAMPSCPFITPGRKLGLGLAAASLLFGATAHAQLYVNDEPSGNGGYGVTEYSLDGTETGAAYVLDVYGSQGMGVTDGSVYISQFNQSSVAVVNPTTLASYQLSLVNTDSSTGNNPDGDFTAGGGELYVDDNTNNLKAYNAVTGKQDASFIPFTTPNSGSLSSMAYTNGDLFVSGVVSSHLSVNEYNASTGTQIGSSPIITGTGGVLAADGNLLYIGDGTDLYSYNLTSDTLSSALAYTGSSAHYLAATSDALFVSEGSSVLKFDLNSDGTIAGLDASFPSVSSGAGAITAIDVAIPEPSSTALIILGMGSLLLVIRRRGALSS